MSNTDAPPPPKVGEDIYVPTALYLEHGRDDFAGGLARVAAVTPVDSNGRVWVEIEERPGRQYNWEFLGPQQSELRAEHGDGRSHPDPDLRREFNED